MEYAQLITTIIVTVATVANLVVVIIYTRYTAKMTSASEASAKAAHSAIEEMKQARIQENAPYVVAYFDILSNHSLINLIIKNVGKSIAEDIKLVFTPPLSSAFFKEINDTALIKNGIYSLPPNYEIKILFDTATERFQRTRDLPLTYTVEISYIGGISGTREFSKQTLDISVFFGLLSTNERDMDDLAKATENIAKYTEETSKKLKDISDALKGGIWIKNPLITVRNENPYTYSWLDMLNRNLKEFLLIWDAAYNEGDAKFSGSFLSDLQKRSGQIKDQILIACSSNSYSSSENLADDLKNITRKLADLSKKRFYVDGGRSANEFDALGDEIAHDIKEYLSNKNSRHPLTPDISLFD